MLEREPIFSDQEREGIKKAAIAMAQVGEDAIWDIVITKLKFQKAAYLTGDKNLIVDLDDGEHILTPDQVKHEIAVMGEVIRQARTIMQIEGRDELSVLDKHMQDAGWGSIFDPDSEAFKKVGHILIE